VDRRLGSLHALGDRRVVGEVALDQLAAQLTQRGRLLRRAHQCHNIVAARPQLAHDVAADEPCSSRNEDLHPAILTTA
jgi:hypothetical protein